jgi:hypothetical protein
MGRGRAICDEHDPPGATPFQGRPGHGSTQPSDARTSVRSMSRAIDSSPGAAPGRVLTGEPAALYLVTWMQARAAGAGVDARKLRGDALAAGRGDRAALGRLRSAVRAPRAVSVAVPLRRLVAGGVRRSRRNVRPSRCARRARSPGRCSSDVPLAAHGRGWAAGGFVADPLGEAVRRRGRGGVCASMVDREGAILFELGGRVDG